MFFVRSRHALVAPLLLFVLSATTIAQAQDDPTRVGPEFCEPLDLTSYGGDELTICDSDPAFEASLAGGQLRGSWEAPSDGSEGYQISGDLAGLSVSQLTIGYTPTWAGELSATFTFRYDGELHLSDGTVDWTLDGLVAQPFRFELGLGLALAVVTPTRFGDLSGNAEISDGVIRLTGSNSTNADDVTLSIDSGGEIEYGDALSDVELDLVLRAHVSDEWVASNGLGPILDNVFIFSESCTENQCDLHLEGPVGRLAMTPAE